MDTSHLPPKIRSCHITESPKERYGGLEEIKKLGEGDNGSAFLVREPGRDHRFVLKEMTFRNEKDAAMFQSEVHIGYILGEEGVAPKVYNCWVYQDPVNGQRYGYYTMDLMDGGVYGDVYPSSGRFSIDGVAPVNVEKDLVNRLRTMINAGFIHNDNHPGNIGIMGGKVVLFDFGFTRYIGNELGALEKRSARQAEDVKTLLLGFSLYQVVEHYNKEILHMSYVYQLACAISKRAFSFSQDLPDLSYEMCRTEEVPNSWISFFPNNIRKLARLEEQFIQKENDLIRKLNFSLMWKGDVPFDCSPYRVQLVEGNIMFPEVVDVGKQPIHTRTYIVGFCLYQLLIVYSKDIMYDSSVYDYIYRIRQNIPAQARLKLVGSGAAVRAIRRLSTSPKRNQHRAHQKHFNAPKTSVVGIAKGGRILRRSPRSKSRVYYGSRSFRRIRGRKRRRRIRAMRKKRR